MDLEPDVTRWLLAGDAAVRWQVHRDLLDAAPEVVDAERRRVATTGWGARLLAEQDHDGTWAGTLYSPKWTSTTYTLLLLRQLGLPAPTPRAQLGCRRLLDGASWFDGGLTFARTAQEAETCITALVVSVAAAFACEDERVASALAWLLAQQLGDGGWNCESIRRGSVHGSFDTTILVLEALRCWEVFHGPQLDVTLAADRGREFFLEHRMYRSHRTGEVVHARYTRPVFPPGWHHDLLRGLDHFRDAGADADDRLADAIERLQSAQRPDGTWSTPARHPGRYWFDLEPVGQPGRINTLRAARVLRWWDRAAPETHPTPGGNVRGRAPRTRAAHRRP